MSKTAQEESKKSGRWVLLGLVSFFVVFASVDALFVYKALSTNTGVVAEHPYETGLKYNQILQEAARRKAASHDGAAE